MMEYKGYIGAVEFDEDAQILHGRVVGIRDVITFQADKASDIPKAFHDSVDDYLAFCTSRGEQPDRAYSGQFVLRLDPKLHRKLDMLADASKKSLNAVATELLDQAVQSANSKPAKRRVHRFKSGERGVAKSPSRKAAV